MKRPAVRGTQHEAIPRHRSTWNLPRFARPTRFPFVPGASDEPVTMAPGNGSRRQTSYTPSVTLISADPPVPDATWPDEPSLSATETGTGRIRTFS